MRRPCRAKRPRLPEPLFRRFQDVHRSLRHRLRHFGFINRIAICLEHLQIERQFGKRLGIPSIRREESQIEREFYGGHSQNAIGKRNVRRERRHVSKGKHYTVNNAYAHDNANGEKHAAKASARRKEQRGKEYYEQRDIPGHKHVIAKRVAIIASPIGIGEIEGEHEMVHVVRKHDEHGERRNRHDNAPRITRPGNVVERGGAHRAQHAQRRYRRHGNVVAIPQQGGSHIAANGIFQQHVEHPERDKGRNAHEPAADFRIGASNVHRKAPCRRKGAERDHVASGGRGALRRARRGRPPKRIELEQRDNSTRKNARNHARDNEHLPLRYVGHAQHSFSINARAFSFWVDWLMLPSRFGPTGHIVARRFERFFRHNETQRAGCPITHAHARNASVSRPRERKNHGFVESWHWRRRRRARRFVA